MIDITHIPYVFVASATEKSGESTNILQSLGIDVKILIFQIIAFGILVGALTKWVFPVLIKALDQRQAAIEASLKAAHRAEKQAANAQAEVQALLKEARTEANDIVTTAKDEAATMVAQAEQKSRAHADRIVAEAQESLQKEVLAAKRALHDETLELVAQATEKVVGKTVTDSIDASLISESLQEVQK